VWVNKQAIRLTQQFSLLKHSYKLHFFRPQYSKLITKIRRLKKEKVDFDLEEIWT